jgi:translation initiation factor IF-2
LAQATTTSSKKVRVFELAKTLGLDTKAVLDYARDLGYDVKNQLSSLEPDQADALKQRIAKGGRPGAATAAAPRPTILPKVEKKITTLPAPPKKAELPALEEPIPVAEAIPEVEEPTPEPVAAPRPTVDIPSRVPVLQPPRPAVVEEAPPVVEPPAPSAPAPAVAPEPAPASPAASAEAPPAPKPLPPVAPPRVQTIGGRPPTLGARPATPNVTPRPGPGVSGATPPRAPAAGGPARPGAGVPPRPGAAPSRPAPGAPGSGARPGPIGQARPGAPGARPGPGGPRPGGPPGTGAPGTGDARHRRPLSQRGPGALARPGQAAAPTARGGGPGAAAPPGAGVQGRKFTPEEIRAMRDGRSFHEVRRAAETPATTTGKDEPEGDEDTKTRKGGAPAGKGGEKDRRAAERARRTAQRQGKVQVSNVVVQGGRVDLADEQGFGSRRGPRAALLKKQRRQLKGTVERKGKVPISLPITVRSLSEAIGMKATELLFKLKDLTNALFTINSTVETEVAELIATEKGVELDIQRQKTAEEELFGEHEEAAGDESKLEPRAPIVTIMGHVDHGKTSLLDTIRKQYGIESDVVSTEAGGITQVIRAWRVEKDGKPITFLDTPGHEAFTKMRARGANVTDIAVIVVAADSGVQPQTEEAVAHAKAAGVSIIVAINKMDMPGADPAKVERQLYNLELLPDTMGGDVQFVRTSAVKGTGIGELLDTIGLVSELKELKANPHKPAQGTCLEAYMTGDEGVMATLLVQQGTLNRGDVMVCGAAFGRVRAMYDDLGRPIQSAGPSVPVRITGLDEVPNADDHFHVVAELGKAREIAAKRKLRQQEASLVRFSPVTLDKLGAAKANKVTELKVILKAEARGSVEAIRKELEKLVHDEVRVRVLHAAIGAITESDVQLALASPEDSMIVGFNVVPDDEALKLAEERNIPLREYTIIYKLTEDIKAALEGKLKPEERVIHLGRAVVRQTFKISKVGTAAGCYVTQGTIERSAKIRVIREGAVIYPPGEKVASLESLKRFKDDVKEVKEGYDCGMKVAGYDDIKVGDVIEAYRIEQVQRTL